MYCKSARAKEIEEQLRINKKKESEIQGSFLIHEKIIFYTSLFLFHGPHL